VTRRERPLHKMRAPAIARVAATFGLCVMVSGCLGLNHVTTVDAAERFDAKERDALLLFGISRDVPLAPAGVMRSGPRGFVFPFLVVAKRDPQSGAMIGDCVRWDHFVAYPDPHSADAVVYFLLRAPVAIYATNGDYDETRRHFAIRPGVINYLGDFIPEDSRRVTIRHDIEGVRRFLLRYPGIDAALEPVELLPGGGGGFFMPCGP
jgi:hypothetical protein